MNRNEITELQFMLRRIAQYDSALPVVNPTGVYDEQTKKAVTAFQKQEGLPATGKVDLATWEAIVFAYRNLPATGNPCAAFSPFPGSSYCIKAQEESDIVLIVQIMLGAVSTTYDAYYDIRPSGVYDEKTMDAITHFQGIHRLPQTGEVDAATWNALAGSYQAFGQNGQYQS